MTLSNWTRRRFAELAGLACLTVGVLTAPLDARADAEVLLSLTSNVSHIRAFDRVAVLRKPIGSQSSGSGYELQPLVKGLQGDTVLLGRSLPAGDYEVVMLRQSLMLKSVELNEDSRKIIGRFVVADGQAIDLGRLVATSMNHRVMVGRSRGTHDNLALLRRYEPGRAADFLAAAKGGAPVRGWVSAPDDEDIAEAYAIQHPTAFLRPTEGADGRLVAASRMGSVLVRGRSGTWTRIGSDRLETVNHALPVDADGIAMVAVGEHSLLLRQSRGEPEMKALDPGNLPKGDLNFIAGSPQLGWWVAVQQGRKIQLMKSAQLDAGQWTLEREIDASPLLRDSPPRVWMWPTAEGLGYAHPRGPVALLDLLTGQWVEHRTPQGFPMMAMDIGPNGQLSAVTVSASGLAGEHALLFRSTDNGANWQRLPALPVRGSPVPALPHHLADGGLVMVGGDYKAPVLHASSDAGQTWSLRKLPDANSRLHALPSGLLMADSSDFGWLSLKSSKDGGLSWTNEISGFDSRAYQAEKAKTP